MRLIHLSEALKMFRRARHVRRRGFKTYAGSPVQIAKQIIETCWEPDRGYFRVSPGHFNEFYCRDFGMCVDALVKLGHRDRVIKTLDYALCRFRKHGRITTTISHKGVCFDFPYYGADSLPFIMHSIRAAKAKELLEKYGPFLKSEIDYYDKDVLDHAKDLIRADKHFSSMKDYAKRSSSCYSNCMLYMLADDLDSLRFYCPFDRKRIKAAIMDTFWNGRFFYDDSTKAEVVTGDANTYPFWCGVTGDKKTFSTCVAEMETAGLTRPFPLKYTTEPGKIHRMHFLELFAGDYERDTVWMHLGLCFLDVVAQFDRKRFGVCLERYEDLIKRHRTFLEVYDRDGKPFNNAFYYTDESMLWVSKWLARRS